MIADLPIVNYLVIDGDEPYLQATVCDACEAAYLGSRIACARCGKRTFHHRRLPSKGTVGSFTIIHRAAPSIPTPFVSVLVDLEGGTAVKANLVGCPPDPEHVSLGMAVELTTFEAAADESGTRVVAFGFVPSDRGVTE